MLAFVPIIIFFRDILTKFIYFNFDIGFFFIEITGKKLETYKETQRATYRDRQTKRNGDKKV